jgi:hypothetical protein
MSRLGAFRISEWIEYKFSMWIDSLAEYLRLVVVRDSQTLFCARASQTLFQLICNGTAALKTDELSKRQDLLYSFPGSPLCKNKLRRTQARLTYVVSPQLNCSIARNSTITLEGRQF